MFACRALQAPIDALDRALRQLCLPAGGKPWQLHRRLQKASHRLSSGRDWTDWDITVFPFHLFAVHLNETPGLEVSIWVSAKVVICNPVCLSILHKHVVILLQEEVGVPVKAQVLVDCPTHFASVRVAVTNIAVTRTYFTESPAVLVWTGTANPGPPSVPGADTTILAGVWLARWKHFGTRWSCVREFADTAVIGRLPGKEAFSLATGVVLALVSCSLTAAPREGGWAVAAEGVPSDDTVPTVFTGVGLAWIIVCIVPVRVLEGGRCDAGVFLWARILVAVVIVIRNPIWVWGRNDGRQ